MRYPLFDAFDAPDTQSACPRRETSTHALQALTLLNSDFAAGRAKVLARRVLHEAGRRPTIGFDAPIRLALAREPKPNEIERARSFVKAQADRIRNQARDGLGGNRPAGALGAIEPAEAAAWVDLALALLNSNEFLYVP